MKRAVAVLATLVLLALGGQAVAQNSTAGDNATCTIDAVPAATLLLPYFEVDFTTEDDNKAITTFFTIKNASSAPALAHVTLWTDLSIPSVDFDVYLTGYDVQPINLRDVFKNGNLPRTATPNRDPDDDISPHEGENSDNPDWDDPAMATPPINQASCTTFFPFTNPALNAALINRLQKGHTGEAITGDTCLGLAKKSTTVDGETVPLAIGYITVDSVTSCSVVFPGATTPTAYFQNGGAGIANNRNVLWGDYFIVDPANNAAFGDNLVHIKADDTVINASGGVGTTNFSFYSRYGSPADNREPLANAWGVDYITGGAFDGGTRLAVWRDSRVNNLAEVNCGDRPYTALEEGQVVAFNQREDAVELCVRGGRVSPPQPDIQCFPDEINWVTVGGDIVKPPFANGWLYLNLDIIAGSPATTTRSQAWVTAVLTALGRYEVGFPGIQLNSACFDNAPDIDGTVGEEPVNGNGG